MFCKPKVEGIKTNAMSSIFSGMIVHVSSMNGINNKEYKTVNIIPNVNHKLAIAINKKVGYAMTLSLKVVYNLKINKITAVTLTNINNDNSDICLN